MDYELKNNIILRINKKKKEAINEKGKIDYELENMINSIAESFKFRISADIHEMVEQNKKKKLALEYYILTLDMIIENENFDYDFLEDRYYLFYRGMTNVVYSNVSLAMANAYYDVMHIVDIEKKRFKGS